jgi:hypothetical protein
VQEQGSTDEPRNIKGIVRSNKRIWKELLRNQRSPPLASACAAPFGFVASLALVAVACHGVFGVLVLERRSLDWQRFGSRRLGERIGAPEVLIYGTSKEIVARDRGAYLEKFGRWRDFLNRIVVKSFGIQAEPYLV